MQAQVNPALGALLQTAQMVTPEQTPTVAAQVAQVAAQKMQPQGIMGGMPQARQDFRTAAEIDNMKRMQMQQAMQQMAAQMTARPAGIEGLPAQNMQTFSAAQGGVVGFANEGYVDTKLMRMTPEEYERKRREAMLRGPAPERIRRTPEEEVIFRSLSEPPPMQDIPVPEVVSAQFVAPEAQRLMDRQRSPAPRPPAPATRPPAAAPVPTGIAAALAERPQYDVASIPAAGAPYMKAGEEDVARLRTAENARAAFEKTLPDLSAKGIAALETAEQERQRLLGVQRGDDKFNRQIALLRGFQGDRAAYDRVVAAQQARDDLARQAQLSFEQARIKEMQAQQARQLNQFDRAIGLEREASALMEKARDNALKAQQIQQGIASSQFQGAVQMRGQDITAQTAAADRATQLQIARIQAAARNDPQSKEAMAMARVQQAINSSPMLKALAEQAKFDPSAAARYRVEEEALYKRVAPELFGAAGASPAAASNDPLGLRR